MALKYQFSNFDAGENAFFSKALEHTRARAFEEAFPELIGRSLVSMADGVDPGAETFRYEIYKEVGYAQWARDYSRGPRVDLYGVEAFAPIRHMKAAYGFNVQELRAARLAKSDLPARKPRAARKAIEKLLDEAIWNGGGGKGLLGLANQTGTTTFTATTGGGGTKLWADKTPDEILEDLYGMESQVITDTLDIEHPTRLLLPLSSYGRISTLRMGDGDSNTVLNHYLKNSRGIKDVRPSFKLETAGAGTTRRAIAYDPNPDKIEGVLPLEFSQLPPQMEGYEIITNCEARSGGVVLYFPKSMCYMDAF